MAAPTGECYPLNPGRDSFSVTVYARYNLQIDRTQVTTVTTVCCPNPFDVANCSQTNSNSVPMNSSFGNAPDFSCSITFRLQDDGSYKCNTANYETAWANFQTRLTNAINDASKNVVIANNTVNFECKAKSISPPPECTVTPAVQGSTNTLVVDQIVAKAILVSSGAGSASARCTGLTFS